MKDLGSTTQARPDAR